MVPNENRVSLEKRFCNREAKHLLGKIVVLRKNYGGTAVRLTFGTYKRCVLARNIFS